MGKSSPSTAVTWPTGTLKLTHEAIGIATAAPNARPLLGPKSRSAGANAGMVGSRPDSHGRARPPSQPAHASTTPATKQAPSTATPGPPAKVAAVGVRPAARQTTAITTARRPSTIIAITAAITPAAESRGAETPISGSAGKERWPGSLRRGRRRAEAGPRASRPSDEATRFHEGRRAATAGRPRPRPGAVLRMPAGP